MLTMSRSVSDGRLTLTPGMFTLLRPGGVLVTYSAKGTVKQALRAAGFDVTRLPGALGKRHMVRALRPME